MAEVLKPKIVYVLPRYDSATGSHFFHLYEMVSRVSGSGYLDVFLVIEKAKSSPIDLAVPFSCQRFSFPLLRFLELVFLLARERARGRRYFYTHYSYYGALASWLVTRIFGGTAYYWNCGMPWLYRRSFFEEAVFRFILSHTILVTGTSGLAAEYRRRYGLRPERTRVLPNWVNAVRFENAEHNYDRNYIREKLNISIDAKVVLFVHRLSRRKGAHLLPEIAAEVIRLGAHASADSAKRRKDVMFVIVGDGPEKKNLESRIKNQGLERYVRIIGEVPHRDIPTYFRAADVFLMPSEEEGFPHVLLEAMAAGVPYIASDVGGVSEITPPELQRYVVPSGNIRLFSESLIELLTLPGFELDRIAAIEREWVKQYDTSAVLSKFVGIFGS